MNPVKHFEERRLWAALLAAAISVIGLAFLLGCFYPYLFVLLDSDQSSSLSRTFNFASLTDSIEIGFAIAMMTLPAIVVLTCGVAWPVFRRWIRRGYSSFAAYGGGGLIVAMVGELGLVNK